MKPRVLITIDTYEIGGAGKVIIQFLNNGGKELCEPTVAGFWRGPEGKWQFRDAVVRSGVEFCVLKQKAAFDPLVIIDALRLVRQKHFHILESHGYKAHVVCCLLSRIAGLPWVAYVHGWTSENVKVKAYNILEKWIVRFADRIIPVSESMKSRLELNSAADRKAIVVANAADLVDTEQEFVCQRERYNVGPDEILIGVIGRFSPEKGHRYFVDAMKIITASHKRVKAVFVGDGQEFASVTEAIRLAGLENKIILTGFQPDVSSFYNACDIICMPSLCEGMPNVALEAMMFRKPVVAFAVGGIPEVVVDGVTGVLVEQENPRALADALLQVMGDPQRMARMGDAGRRRVEAEFNPGVRTERVAEIYVKLIQN